MENRKWMTEKGFRLEVMRKFNRNPKVIINVCVLIGIPCTSDVYWCHTLSVMCILTMVYDTYTCEQYCYF